MIKEKHKSQSFMRTYLRSTLMPIIVFGGISGVLTGLIVWGFKWVASFLEDKSKWVYGWFYENPTFIPLLLLGLVVLALLSSIMYKFIPELRTNCISNAEGAMRGMYKYRWGRTIFGTIASSFLSYFAGLSFGAEGPSIQLGGTIGQATNDFGHLIEKDSPAWERYNITGGAAAAFAVAFGAPLSGILYTLEEAHKRLSPMLLMTAASSVFFATLISETLSDLVGLNEYFINIVEIPVMEFKYYWALLLVGVFAGGFASIFNTIYAKTGRFIVSEKFKKVPITVRIIAIFLLTGVIGLLFSDAIGGGHEIIQAILDLDFSWKILLILLFVRLVLLILTANSGAMGGMFVPVLTIGATLGGLLGKMFIAMGLPGDFYQIIVLVTTMAFMSGVMRAPLTAIVLAVELTNSYFSSFLMTGIAAIIAYLIVEALRIEPLYENGLHDAMHKKYNGMQKQLYTFSIVVEEGSFVEGRSVKDILWPYGCTIVNVIKTDEEGNKILSTDKAGDRVIKAGQTYTIKALVYDENKAKLEMEYLTKNYTIEETTELLKNNKINFRKFKSKEEQNKNKNKSNFLNEEKSTMDTISNINKEGIDEIKDEKK